MAYRVIASQSFQVWSFQDKLHLSYPLTKKMDEQSDYFWAPASLRQGSYEQADAQSNFKQYM